MYTFFTILIVIAAIILILAVLVQNSKGGGLAAGFASGNQVMGAPRTADFLERTTWVLAAFIVAFSVVAVGMNIGQKRQQSNSGSAITEQVQEAAAGIQVPTTTPDEE